MKKEEGTNFSLNNIGEGKVSTERGGRQRKEGLVKPEIAELTRKK